MLEERLKRLNARLHNDKLFCRFNFRIIRARGMIYLRPEVKTSKALHCGNPVDVFVPGQRLQEFARNRTCEFHSKFMCTSCFRKLRSVGWKSIRTEPWEERYERVQYEIFEKEIRDSFEGVKPKRPWAFPAFAGRVPRLL